MKKFRKIIMGKRSVALISDTPSIYKNLDWTVDGVSSYEERCNYFRGVYKNLVIRGRFPPDHVIINFAKKLLIEKKDVKKIILEMFLLSDSTQDKKELKKTIRKSVEEIW